MNGTCLGASSPGNRNVSEPWEQGCLLRRALGRHLRGSGGCGRSGQSRRGCGWCLGRFEAWMIQSHSSYVEALTARTLEHNRFWRCNLRSGCCSVAQSCPTLPPHGLQHVRFSCPSPCPGVCSNSCPLSQ